MHSEFRLPSKTFSLLTKIKRKKNAGKTLFFRLDYLAPGAQVPISWVKLESLEKKKTNKIGTVKAGLGKGWYFFSVSFHHFPEHHSLPYSVCQVWVKETGETWSERKVGNRMSRQSPYILKIELYMMAAIVEGNRNKYKNKTQSDRKVR